MGKKAVLIGCNYPGTKAALRGCINDVWGMKALLEEFYGFQPTDITVMIDTDPAYMKPTGKAIKAEISRMVTEAQDGDTLFLHFSGHGTQIPSSNNDEADGKDEAICPCDMNVICDDDLRVLLKPLEAKPHVRFTFVSDCCHSGTILDHEEVQISGPKAGTPPPPTFDAASMQSLLAGLGAGGAGGRDMVNRSLPFNDLCGMLSSLLGGAQVNATNVRSNMGTLFGADASAKVQQFMQVYSMLTQGAKALGGAGGGGGGGLLQALCACMMPPADQNGQNGAQQQAPEPAMAAQLPPPGAKPPPSERLSDDVGVLVTGCQSHETSADACPTGDPNKAHGALSNAIQTVVRRHHAQQPGQPLTYRNLVISVRELLAKTGFSQNPCLECADKHADTPFIAA